MIVDVVGLHVIFDVYKVEKNIVLKISQNRCNSGKSDSSLLHKHLKEGNGNVALI